MKDELENWQGYLERLKESQQKDLFKVATDILKKIASQRKLKQISITVKTSQDDFGKWHFEVKTDNQVGKIPRYKDPKHSDGNPFN